MQATCLLSVSLLGPMAVATAAQGPLFRRQGDLAGVRAPGQSLETALRALLAGPSAAQRAAGLTTAIPTGTKLAGLGRRGQALEIRVGARFLDAGDAMEDAIEQVVKTALRASVARRADIFVRGRDGRLRRLADLLAPAPRVVARARGAGDYAPQALGGALAGKTIAVSPGHGYYYHTTLGWTTQRPLIGGLIEDIHTNEIVMRYVIPYLRNLGARVVSCRERGEVVKELVLDNDGGSSVYAETGTWSTSLARGWGGGTYRFAAAGPTATSTATWSARIARSGRYPVSVFYRAGANRSPQATYEVWHAGGVSTVTIDQTKDDRRWRHLGAFWFDAGATARVVLRARGPVSGRVVAADVARIGAGMGSTLRGGSASGQPRWKECSVYWARYAGAPASVYDPTTGPERSDDVTARPLYAEWRGADAYLSLHTNAGGGTGTSSYIHNTSPTKGSAALQAAVQSQVVADIRAYYDASWTDRGRRSANFGEVRALSTMPGVLVELAFHDRAGSKDHEALHDPRFRRIAGRALARGILRYFKPGAAFAPARPTALRVTQDSRGGLRVAWDAVPGATLYSVETSKAGKQFAEAAQTSATSWSTGPLAHASMLSFRVRALDASGRSEPSEVLCAGTSHDGSAELLLVQGFDRLGKAVKGPENTFDYLRLHGDAIRRAAEFSLGFDAASNEAVQRGRLSLGAYRAVDWALGEESTRDETFATAEQSLVASYLKAGGRLLVSGAELGWDLWAKGSAADRAFFQQVLGLAYVRDDAGTYGFAPVAGGVFAGLPAGSFDNGSGGTYDVDWPDVLGPADTKSRLTLSYTPGTQGAGVERVDGASRVVAIGFPLETVTDPALRAALMRRALRFLLAPRALETGPQVALGQSLPIALAMPGERGNLFVLALSGSNRPGQPLPPLGTFPLVADPLLALSLGANNGVFRGFLGLLDAQGRAGAALAPPRLASLRGTSAYVSGLTLGLTPLRLSSLMPWYRVVAK